MLKELVPSVDRVMVLADPANTGLVSVAQEAALPLHVTIHPVITAATADAEREIEAFANRPGGGMIVIPYGLTIAERATITALAARHRLPAVFDADAFISVGGPFLTRLIPTTWRGRLRDTPTETTGACARAGGTFFGAKTGTEVAGVIPHGHENQWAHSPANADEAANRCRPQKM